MQQKVYIPNSGAKHDFSPAEEFGELVYVTEGRISPRETGSIFRVWEEALQNSNKHDYIMICSLNIICSIGSAIFAAKHGRINFLIFRSKSNKYEARTHIIKEE